MLLLFFTLLLYAILNYYTLLSVFKLLSNIFIKEKRQDLRRDIVRIYEIEDICELLKIGKSTAYELVRTKELESFKLHGIWKISEDALQNFINKSIAKQS